MADDDADDITIADAVGAHAAAAEAVNPAVGVKVPGRLLSRNPLAATRLSAIPGAAIAGMTTGVLIAIGLIFALVIAPANSNHASALAEASADHASAQIENLISGLQASTRRIAEASATAQAVRSDDDAAIATLEARMATTLPDALRVRINPLGAADIALTESPPLTFAGLDLISRAESGELAGPEYINTDSGGLINISAAIPTAGSRPLGTVLVTFSPNAFSRPLQALPARLGHYSLRQSFANGEPIEIAGHGAGSGGTAVVRELSIDNWSLEFRPATDAAVASFVLALPGWILVILMGGGGALLAHRRYARSLRKDIDRLLESANAMSIGRTPVAGKDYDLDDFAVAGATLVELARGLEVTRAPKKKVAPAIVTRPPPEEKSSPGFEVSELAEEDDEFLEIAGALDIEADSADDLDLDPDGPEVIAAADVPPDTIFRDYDIRGIVGEMLTTEHAVLIGRAIGSTAVEAGEHAIAVAGDCRHSTAELKAALIEGLTRSGIDVVDIGEVPTPVLYHTTLVTKVHSGVMVTGSHNAAAYNGFKIVIAGETLASGRIAGLQQRIRDGNFTSGAGSVTSENAVDRYVDEIAGDIALAQPLKVVVDCGNGVAGTVMPALLEALGCEVLPLYCDLDGDFPNHHPDPADPANLEDLQTVVRAEGADFGIALDGDGDRLGVVSEKGDIIWPDRLMMLFSRDIVGRNPGADVIFDVKCSRHLNSLIADHGGRPIMWKTGHAHLKAKMQETGALLGGELSGHICFGERWHGFDDGLYSAARFAEIVGGETMPVSEIFDEFPSVVSTPEIRIEVPEARKFEIIDQLIAAGTLTQGDVTDIDGLRIDFPDGWGLVRASNTSPALTLRFEGDTAAAVNEIADMFRSALQEVDASLDFATDL